ncbi:MAG TPA: CsbD family protein [Candidatus Limnocylindrales bacterium]
MGNEQQNQGKLEQAEGSLKENIGDAIGNDRMQREGQIDQAKGQVREGVGDVREGVDKAADDWNRDR